MNKVKRLSAAIILIIGLIILRIIDRIERIIKC